MKSDRVVIDTKVLISAALIAESLPARARDHALQHGKLVATSDTVNEFVDRIQSPKFDAYVSRAARATLAAAFQRSVEIVPVIQVIRGCRDPRDDKFLEAAVNGRANVIITGDKDLLILNPFAGIQILSPKQYLGRVAEDVDE